MTLGIVKLASGLLFLIDVEGGNCHSCYLRLLTCYSLSVCDFSKPIHSDRTWLISKGRVLRTWLELDGGVHTKLVNTLKKKQIKPFYLSTMKTKADIII